MREAAMRFAATNARLLVYHDITSSQRQYQNKTRTGSNGITASGPGPRSTGASTRSQASDPPEPTSQPLPTGCSCTRSLVINLRWYGRGIEGLAVLLTDLEGSRGSRVEVSHYLWALVHLYIL